MFSACENVLQFFRNRVPRVLFGVECIFRLSVILSKSCVVVTLSVMCNLGKVLSSKKAFGTFIFKVIFWYLLHSLTFICVCALFFTYWTTDLSFAYEQKCQTFFSHIKFFFLSSFSSLIWFFELTVDVFELFWQIFFPFFWASGDFSRGSGYYKGSNTQSSLQFLLFVLTGMCVFPFWATKSLIKVI